MSAVMLLATSGAFAQRRLISCARNPGTKSMVEWYGTIQNGHGYLAPIKRRNQILDNYKLLKIGMTKREVAATLGAPDYDAMPKVEEVDAGETQCRSSW